MESVSELKKNEYLRYFETVNKQMLLGKKLKSFFIEERKYLWFVMSRVCYIRGSLSVL